VGACTSGPSMPGNTAPTAVKAPGQGRPASATPTAQAKRKDASLGLPASLCLRVNTGGLSSQPGQRAAGLKLPQYLLQRGQIPGILEPLKQPWHGLVAAGQHAIVAC
jgi:hypothetical protein